MNHVLLTCVGMRDPTYYGEREKETQGPILSLCDLFQEVKVYKRTYMPIHAIYLLPSKERADSPSSTEQNAWNTWRKLHSRGWEREDIHVEPLDVQDITDYWELIPAMKEVVEKAIQREGEECEYLVYLSPGTSQMETTWIILYIANLLPERTIFLQKKEERYGQKEELVREINTPSFIPTEVVDQITEATPKEEGVYCDALSGRIWVDGTDVTPDLGPKEKKLLRLLYRNPGRIYSKSIIESAVWEGRGKITDAMIYKTLSRLRDRVEPHPENPQYIITVRGEGYTLRQP